MFGKETLITGHRLSAIQTHKVLRNTYFLLSLTLFFSAITAYAAMAMNAQPPGLVLTLVGMFGLSFLTQYLSRSAWGLASIFAFTGFMGYILGPILNLYIHQFSNGGALVMTALGGTGLIFLALSAYALSSEKDFSFMGGMLFAFGIMVFIGGLLGIFFQAPIYQLIISGLFAMFASAMILFETSAIIHGGEQNYILATISLYMALFNLFLSLLRILSFFAGNRD